MKTTIKLFVVLTVFFLLVGTVYGLLTHGEAVGMGALLLSGGLAGMIAFYLVIVDRRSGQMPEDDPHGEIADGAGDLGTFAPWSWWPLVLGLSAAVAFTGLAVGFWIMVPAVVLATIGLVGWVFEFSRGQHAH
ncbi:cytochrome c oxidase subunit 4 [Actinotalea sp. M2MS4P-6]|uniref:cytochrome c oxidase subunit 4 n=1 Tax=Actinotalea sp. M2MS4P-6 TaxID=2983762 RepID=UPI0021E4658D|nr:cytochrome c oxidase subunit 4 [Actinotalea sp. M2MS4P-6]MCV2396451.1 cytochrome c oxidase subunit 4 [Actinotalea sp. M2MS4P-6]